MQNPKALYQLMPRIFGAAAKPPFNPEMVYPFGQREVNEASVLDAAARFSCPIAIAGEDNTAKFGFPGFTAWKQSLAERGVRGYRIIAFPGTFKPDAKGDMRGSTFTEMTALVPFLKKMGVRSLVALAPEWHILRCYMTAVGVAVQEYPELKIYPAFGDPLPWDEDSEHSQGTTLGKRWWFLITETARLWEYEGRGVPRFEVVLDYMDRFDL